MTFPTVVSITPRSFGTAAGEHNITLPATIAADDLILIFWAHKSSSITILSTPTGYTELAAVVHATAAAGNPSMYIWAKKAVGDEDGTDVVADLSSSSTGCAQVYIISGWHGTVASDIAIATLNNGASTTTPDPPASGTVSWGGSEDNLFIAAAAGADDDETFSGAPANYGNLTSTNTGNAAGASLGCEIGTARRELAADSDNPGTFTLSASEAYVAATIVIRPAAGGGATSILRQMMMNH